VSIVFILIVISITLHDIFLPRVSDTHTHTHTHGFKVNSSTLVKTNNLCTQVLTLHSDLTVLYVTKIILALFPPSQLSPHLSKMFLASGVSELYTKGTLELTELFL